MATALPPFALTPPAFRFAHLATFAGKAPIGGAREVALGCIVVARLAADSLLPVNEEPNLRADRCAAAKTWLGAQTLPQQVRVALVRCAESSVSGSQATIARELRLLSRAATDYLDAPGRAEIEALATTME